LAAYFSLKGLDGRQRRGAGLGVGDFAQVCGDGRLHGFREMVEHVRDLVHPAALVTRAGKDLVQRLPEPERAVADGQLGRHGEPARLEIDEQLAPALGAFADPDLEAQQFLPPFGRRPDDHQHALGLRLHPGLQVDAVGPDVDVAAGGKVPALPAVVVLLPAGRQA